MNLRYLVTLKTILETGSFQHAANKLGYTQSTVTFQIRQLEQEFSIQLFEKVGRKMVITQAGRDILPDVDTVLDAIQKIKSYSKHGAALSGSLKVAMPESLLVYKMQNVLKRFKHIAPRVKLSLHSYSCYTINNYVLSGEIDIGIQYDIEGYTGQIAVEELEKIDLTMVSSADFAAEQFPGNLSETSLIVSNDPADACRVLLCEYFREEKIFPQDMIQLGSIEAVKRSVINNLGIAYMPRHTIEKELEQGELQELPSDISGKVVTVICAYHKNKYLSPAIELFIQLAKEELKQQPETLCEHNV